MAYQPTFTEVQQLIKNNTLQYFNFYNVDIPTTTAYASKYYLTHPKDTIEISQTMNITFHDIEVFTNNEGIDDITNGTHPIHIAAFLNLSDYILHSFILLLGDTPTRFGIKNEADFNYDQFILNREKEYEDRLRSDGYIGNKFIPDKVKVKIHLYSDERTLIIDFWQKFHEYDPDVISGWNSDLFDNPYWFFRCTTLWDETTAKRIISKFGDVSMRNDRLTILEYICADLLYLYKPRDDGGLNYGKKQAPYTLDNIAEIELGLKKVEYKSTNVTLDDFYLNNPSDAAYYNLADVLLTVGLNNKLQHIELHNLLRRLMKTPFHTSMVGSSSFFEHFVFNSLSGEDKVIRYAINSELGKTIDVETINKFPVPRNKKNINVKVPTKISTKEYNSIITKFPGAFVKETSGEIINDGSMIIDLDATSMYPSIILQSNISFDSYRARLIPPACYTTLKLLEQYLGVKPYPPSLAASAMKAAFDYVDREKIASKEETGTKIYYIIMTLFDTLAKHNIPLQKIYNPTTSQESILLKTVLTPLLDIMNTIHPQSQKYNTLAYDYVYLDYAQFKAKYPFIYILYNPNESNTHIKCLPTDEAISYIKTLVLTFAGTLFTKHDDHLGLFADFLQRMQNMRNSYKKKLKEYDPNSLEYAYNNSRQTTVKIIMNTTYGLYGLSTFRYSNHWLARSITNNGMITIKLATYMTEEYLKYNYK